MGIYKRREECGCEWVCTTYAPYCQEYPSHRCTRHGGTALASSIKAAREWWDTDCVCADPQSTTSAP